MKPVIGMSWVTGVLAKSRSLRVDTARLHHRRSAWSNRGQTQDRQLLVVVERGQLSIELERGVIRLEAGCGCWCPMGVARALVSTGGIERHFNLGIHALEPFARGPVAQATAKSQLWSVVPFLHRLREEAVRGDDVRCRALVAMIAADFLAAPGLEHSGGPSLRPEQRDVVERWVAEHAVDGVEPSDIARVLGLSADYATRCFRASFGMSPRRWLRDERIRKAAADMVDEGLSIAAVSERYGFTDASFFCKQFRAVLGCSPGVWRKREVPAEGMRRER
jgi:AraC-like DNA-binding protein